LTLSALLYRVLFNEDYSDNSGLLICATFAPGGEPS
jgi:hypothetical protein